MIEPYVFTVFLIPALVAGMWICEGRSSRPDSSRRAYLAGVVGGIIGARLWYALQYGDFSIAGGWASWGFVLGGSISAVCWLRWETGRAAFGEFADAVAPALALGGAFVRVACLSVILPIALSVFGRRRPGGLFQRSCSSG